MPKAGLWRQNCPHRAIRSQHFLLSILPEIDFMVVYKRSKDLGTVVLSVNATGEALCVDFFQRGDNSYGFEEYRRDVETNEGWFPIGFHSGRRFETLDQAKSDAKGSVAWLESEM